MAITIYTSNQVLSMIKAYVEKFKSNAAAARNIGCTSPVLSQVLQGKIPPPPSVCEAIGIERVKLYAKGVKDYHRE